MADDFQRLLAGKRRAHHLLDILGVTYFQGVHDIESSSGWLIAPANTDGPVDPDTRVDNKPVGLRVPPLRRLIANWFVTSHLIRFAPGPGAILRSRIDNDFSFGSLVRTTFTARPEPRSVTFAAGPPGGGIQRSPHCDSAYMVVNRSMPLSSR